MTVFLLRWRYLASQSKRKSLIPRSAMKRRVTNSFNPSMWIIPIPIILLLSPNHWRTGRTLIFRPMNPLPTAIFLESERVRRKNACCESEEKTWPKHSHTFFDTMRSFSARRCRVRVLSAIELFCSVFYFHFIFLSLRWSRSDVWLVHMFMDQLSLFFPSVLSLYCTHTRLGCFTKVVKSVWVCMRVSWFLFPSTNKKQYLYKNTVRIEFPFPCSSSFFYPSIYLLALLSLRLKLLLLPSLRWLSIDSFNSVSSGDRAIECIS